MSTATNNIWFEGPVTEAVALVNSKDCVFVVYIFDDTGNTQKLNETLGNEDVIHALSSKTVALKMHTESDNAKMFKQLYPTYHVPVIYFIRHGTIKDFGVEDVTAEAIISKIDATSSEQQPQQQTSPATPAAPAPAPMSPAPPSTETSAVTDQPQPSQGSSSSEATAAAKKEKLRKQMEEAKKKREEEEKQRAKDNELKRRQDGKLMQQTRQQLENKQNKQYFDKIKKEKREDEEHRRRIKEQIARDRAEQMAARQAAKQQRKSANSSPEPSTTSVKRASSSSSQHDHSSISIRQLDGSTMRNRFNASDTLSVVKNWIDQNRSDGDQPYKLLAQFPTRQFSIGDEERSLRELDLCPSATLIMKGIKNVSNAYGAGSSYGVMDYVYSAGGLLYNAASSVGTTVSGVMYSMFPSDQGAPSEANVQSPGSFPNTGVTQQTPSSIPGQRLGGVPSSARPRSNINTLRNTAFDDDDNEHRTYNGNSVNQE